MSEACYTCRRRHIQCDRSQVPCLKCQKAGLECLDRRPIRWVQGVAIRGGMRGRLYQDPSVCLKPVEGIETRPTPPNGIPQQRTTGFSKASDAVPSSLTLGNVPMFMEDTALSRLDRSSRYYLDYYNDRICQLFIVYDSPNNPFRSLIPLALSEGVLLDAVLALAARHRANFEQPFSTSDFETFPSVDTQEALRFKYRAIQGLSRALSGGSTYQDATVATVFLLVFLDLLESGCDRWNYHLEGAKSLMALIPSHDPGRTIQRIRHFITKQVHLIESLGATFVRPQLLSKSETIDESANLLQDVVEESFLGCPEYILTAVQFLSLQRDIIANGCMSDQAPIEDIIAVFDAVKEFDCYTWAASLRQESATRNVDDLCRLARSYQLGAWLYGQRVLDALQHEQTGQEPVLFELISIINSLKHGSKILKCILWPITIAGLECHTQSQRDILIQALEQFWLDTRCLNVTNAAKILQSYWRKIEGTKVVASDWIFDIGRLSQDWLLI